jgi:hypothetical protein
MTPKGTFISSRSLPLVPRVSGLRVVLLTRECALPGRPATSVVLRRQRAPAS